MKSTLRASLAFWVGAVLFSLSWLQPAMVQGGVCQQGTGVPPFLSSGAEPNLLLLIDNSGSMLDMAYVDEAIAGDTADQCYDGSYDNSSTYTGYFTRTSWYSYDFMTDERFELEGASVPALCSADTTEYYAEDADADKFVCVDLNADADAVTGFVATGNFMNWLAASKFDIQKKILTGGKYDDVNGNLQLESRGCMGKRFVKQVELAQGDFKLALGVRGPMEVYETWLAGKTFETGTVVIYGNVLYKATDETSSDDFATDANWVEYKDTRWYPNHAYPANTAVYDVETDGWYWTQSGGTSSAGADITEDDNITDWAPYDGTSIEIFTIKDDGFNNDACQLAMELITGLTGTDADGSTDDVNSSLGQIKKATEECMGFAPGGGNTVETARKAAFNHAMQECWYYNKFGRWQPGQGTVTSMKTACANAYDYMQPSDITPWDSAYVCTGSYQPKEDKSDYGYVGRCWETPGVPGSCTDTPCGGKSTTVIWDEGSEQYVCDAAGSWLMHCNKNNCAKLPASKPGDWDIVQDCSISGGGDIGPTWTNDDFFYFNPCPYKTCMANDDLLTSCASTFFNSFECEIDARTWACTEVSGDHDNLTDECSTADPDGYLCVEQAIKDFCSILSIPEVIDPSDATTSTGEVWNAPAFLIDGGIVGQLNFSLTTMRGFVQQPTAPEGVLDTVAADLRMGAMAFNDNGSATECSRADVSDTVDQYCPDTNKDGARLIASIKGGKERTGGVEASPVYHVDDLTDAINDTRATAWTPLAEAVYTALGYYGQDPDRRLSADDFQIGADDDPVQYWCQENYLLVITEGASTADIDDDVIAMVEGMADITPTLFDPTVALTDESECVDSDNDSVLYASTYLDDLTYFGQHAPAAELYTTPAIENDDGEWNDKQNITTYIVSTGLLRDDGTDSECNPATLITNAAANGGTTLLTGENPDALEGHLTEVLSDILSRASAGSAASVISSSRSGSGAVYQAIFWPELTDNESEIVGDNDNNTVTWVGDVHSLFMSSGGVMYEDTNQDGKLSPLEDLNNDGDVDDLDAYGEPEDIGGSGESGSDKRVVFYYSENENKTRGCYNITGFLTNNFQCPGDDNDEQTELCGVGDDCVEISDMKYLWSAAKKLRDMDPDDRHILTWNDVNNNGIVDSGEYGAFDTTIPWSTLNATAALPGSARGPVTNDFLTQADWLSFVDNDGYTDSELEGHALDALVDWIRGTDHLNNETTDTDKNGRLDKALRSRQFYQNGVTKEWRLGDIIHSTPIVVSRPAEAYHYIYRDYSYSLFSKRWAKRRNMIYFGANDGMLHAVNGGFYYEHLNQFCCTAELHDDPLLANYRECVEPVNNGTCTGVDLGDEKWAFIPYNLQPHLKCLANPEYDHKYYVDQRPKVVDVQIFEEEPICQTDRQNAGCIHAGGWGTILVGSMRFGGAPVEAVDLNGDNNDLRELTSSFFILDITNPEADPVILGELTRTTEKVGLTDKYVDLNYTTSFPSVVVMRDNDNNGNVNTDWYLVMGNGPTDLDGTNDNDDQGKIAILPLEWLKGELGTWSDLGVPESGATTGSAASIRIPNERPSTLNNEGGTFLIPRTASGEPSYVSDIITVDFDVENQAQGSIGAFYKADAVYFGTTDGTGFEDYPYPDNDQSYWNGGGRLFRLVTKVLSGSNEIHSLPSDWAGEWNNNDPIRMLVDAKAPITAAPSVGYDGDNFWVYAGAGRFFDIKDKTDEGQYYPANSDDRSKVSYFGIREPVDVSLASCFDGKLSWASIDWDINSNDNSNLIHNGTPGQRGLMQVDNILVARGGSASKFIGASFLECAHCTDDGNNPVCSDLPSTDCFPSGLPTTQVVNRDNDEVKAITTFEDLRDYIAGTGCVDASTSSGIDGWYRDFHEKRKRNLGQAALLGGLLTYTGYKPYNDICLAEGESYLYGVHFQTGTAWTESVFGTFHHNGDEFVKDKLSLGRGLATTPSMHVGSGEGATAFVQTSTGEIIEIKQETLPVENVKSGRSSWTDRMSD